MQQPAHVPSHESSRVRASTWLQESPSRDEHGRDPPAAGKQVRSQTDGDAGDADGDADGGADGADAGI